ncbi:hypothetical protein MB84_31335 (plasmid) [Pandoraea oxalativorans]|uniref:Major facilitator superfamily (MFS) profile domain-containing protein n=1 Tax=Pandoraea oxalativorans TaxID=573737 RepID=A0A192B0Q6_9BURK|nr:hypothetical protein MB84_31335 [Pandoraea oxalativorans]
MHSALGFSDTVYGIGAGTFFFGNVLFEIPSNLLLPRVGARKTISRIMVLWGQSSTAMLFVRSAPMFYAPRFMLGVFEAGFAPGIIFLPDLLVSPNTHGPGNGDRHACRTDQRHDRRPSVDMGHGELLRRVRSGRVAVDVHRRRSAMHVFRHARIRPAR